MLEVLREMRGDPYSRVMLQVAAFALVQALVIIGWLLIGGSW